MIFDLERKNNRNMLDIGDIVSYLQDLIITNNKLDKVTIIAVIESLKFVDAEFNRSNPKENILECINIPKGFLIKEVAKVYNNNLKLVKTKKGEEPQAIILEEPSIDDIEFNDKQLEQLDGLLTLQNQNIQQIVIQVVQQLIEYLKKDSKATQTKPKEKVKASDASD